MTTLLIAVGNSLRGDDGAAPAVLPLLRPNPSRKFRVVPQLTPELAEEIARFDRVIFLDADAQATQVILEPAGATLAPAPLTHTATPATVIAFARALYGFTGEALLCRIPARSFAGGESIAPATMKFMAEAARRIEACS